LPQEPGITIAWTEKKCESLSRCKCESDSRHERYNLRYFLADAFAFAGAGAADVVNAHGGAVSAVGVICNGFRLFLVRSALKSVRSLDCIVFQAASVVL